MINELEEISLFDRVKNFKVEIRRKKFNKFIMARRNHMIDNISSNEGQDKIHLDKKFIGQI